MEWQTEFHPILLLHLVITPLVAERRKRLEAIAWNSGYKDRKRNEYAEERRICKDLISKNEK